MEDNQYPIKKKSSIAKPIIIISIVVISSLFVILFIYYFPALLLGGFFDNPPDQDQLEKLVNENSDTFEDVIEYIHTLDSDVSGIEYENGILHLNNSSFSDPEISNEAIKKLFDLGVESIYTKNKNVKFFCGGAGRDYYTGIIYSDDGEPVTMQLDEYTNGFIINFVKSGDGWEGEGDGNDYYCEKITGNWFFYEMWW